MPTRENASECVLVESRETTAGFVLLAQTVKGEAIYLQRELICVNGKYILPAHDYPNPEFPGLGETDG